MLRVNRSVTAADNDNCTAARIVRTDVFETVISYVTTTTVLLSSGDVCSMCLLEHTSKHTNSRVDKTKAWAPPAFVFVVNRVCVQKDNDAYIRLQCVTTVLHSAGGDVCVCEELIIIYLGPYVCVLYARVYNAILCDDETKYG